MLFCFVLLVLASWALHTFAAPLTTKPTLRFAKDGTFQISIFEDLHYGEAENTLWGPLQDTHTTQVINKILDVENPQLAILNGDLITGEDTHLHNSTHYLEAIVAPLISRNIPWASTYGNHDSNHNLSRTELFRREKRYSLSLTKRMVKAQPKRGLSIDDIGVTNYYLPVHGAEADVGNKSEVPKLLLWFFDSRGGRSFQKFDQDGNTVQVPGYVHASVVDWYIKTNAHLQSTYQKANNNNATIPSLAFVHIPTNAMLAFQSNTTEEGGVDPHHHPGINQDVPLDPQVAGMDIEFMEALSAMATQGLMGVFVGHDHGNDWCYKQRANNPSPTDKSNGLNLCFGRHTGYGGYGRWTRGSRQVIIDQDIMAVEGVETYIRLEDSSVSGRVQLNGTFGSDWYEKVHVRYS